MIRKGLFLLVFLFLAVSFLSAEEESIGINEGEFAMLFVTTLGINKELSKGAQPVDATSLLEHYGMAPIDGWNASRPLTLGRLAAILVRGKNIRHESINDSEVCFNNINDINREWFMSFKKENSWATLNTILQDKAKCPFGLTYEEKNNRHLIERHIHPDREKIEEAYIALLIKNHISIPKFKPDETVSRAQVKTSIRSFSSPISALQPYLTPATPILPRDVAAVKMLEGYLVFAIYDNGSVMSRKVSWKPSWAEGSSIEVTVIYANDATLPGSKSIAMFINGIEVSSSTGKWTQDLKPDENIWLGAQSQTGNYPAGARLSDFKTSNQTSLEEILMDEKSLVLLTKLDSLSAVFSPTKGGGGKVSLGISSKKDVFKNDGFQAESKDQYLLFPVENMNHFKGSFSLKITPNFVSSKDEHAFLSTVRWDAKDGADGFYLYYQPEKRP
jgi:hypothetical protein